MINGKKIELNRSTHQKTYKDLLRTSKIPKSAKVCLNFYWKSIRRQIRIEGRATLLNIYEADLYFNNRPTGSKIGAWASSQSKSLKSRSELINRVKEFS